MVQVGPRESLADSYLRFLENQLRAKYGFWGTPISMWVKKGRDIHGLHNS
jgi:predicted GTPase